MNTIIEATLACLIGSTTNEIARAKHLVEHMVLRHGAQESLEAFGLQTVQTAHDHHHGRDA